MKTQLTVVLSEDRNSADGSRPLLAALAGSLSGRAGVSVVVVPHVYDLVEDGPAVAQLRSTAGNMVVLASLYPRAAFWVLRAHGIAGRMGRSSFAGEEETEQTAPPTGQTPPERTLWCLDVRGQTDPAPLVREVARIFEETTGQPLDLAAPRQPGREPIRVEEAAPARWYPVVDLDRCQNCLECLNFCLFGTYGLDEHGHLMVEQPDACRDGCPACSRICPSGAILFPECDDAVIAGAPAEAKQKAGVSANSPSAMQKADDERQAASDPLDHLVDALEESDL
jgi:NAD-dependent dihydropyrimidine dehydrogenase PreA subunit